MLINDLYLHNGGGDIDHVVLGPGGVFVLETKNWSGNITCNGDEWQRAGKQNFKGSPSLQVKRNAAKIKHIIDSSPAFGSLGVWVEGIVVFTNNNASLRLNHPTVSILKLHAIAKLHNHTWKPRQILQSATRSYWQRNSQTLNVILSAGVNV